MDPEKDNTTALQYLEVTVSIGTGTVSLPSVLSFYFDLFTLSLPVAFTTGNRSIFGGQNNFRRLKPKPPKVNNFRRFFD